MTNDGNTYEQDIILLVRKKDSNAIRILYSHYIEYLTAVCSRYVVSEEDVRDILQDSFVKIISSIEKFEYRGAGSLRAWMSKVVVNESLRFLKRNEKFEPIAYEGNLPDMIEEDEPDTTEVPSSFIFDIVRQLPTGYRTVFNLYVFEGKSHREIASILNIKESTSASQYHRAKSILAKKIKAFNSARQ